MADALATLRRLRRLEVEAAHRDLAGKLAVALAAEQRAETARSALRTEADAAPRDAANPLAGGFANWLPAGQNAARAAERAVQTVQDASTAARQATARKRTQLELDDFVPPVSSASG